MPAFPVDYGGDSEPDLDDCLRRRQSIPTTKSTPGPGDSSIGSPGRRARASHPPVARHTSRVHLSPSRSQRHPITRRNVKLGEGSCRDFAWLMVEACRALGLRGAVRVRLPGDCLGGVTGRWRWCAAWRDARLGTGLSDRASAGSTSIRPAAASARARSSRSPSSAIRMTRCRFTAHSWVRVGPIGHGGACECHLGMHLNRGTA